MARLSFKDFANNRVKRGTMLKVKGGMNAKMADGTPASRASGPWLKNMFQKQGFFSGRLYSLGMSQTTALTGDVIISFETLDGQTTGQARAFKAEDLEVVR